MSRRYLQNITIPAAFVQKSVGDSLKQLIKPQRDLPHPKVLVSLDWTDLLPRNEVVSHPMLRHLLSNYYRLRRRRATVLIWQQRAPASGVRIGCLHV